MALLARLSLPLIVAGGAAAVALAAACSNDDSVSPTPAPLEDAAAPADAGADVAEDAAFPSCAKGEAVTPGPMIDAGGREPDQDGGFTAQAPKLQFVNASNKLAAVRICVATGKSPTGEDAKVAPLPALPDANATGSLPPFPGIARGTAGTWPRIVDFSPLTLVLYVVDASKVASEIATNPQEKTCDQLIDGPTPLKADVDYFKLPALPVGTLEQGKTYAVGIYDCEGGGPGPIACSGGEKVRSLVQALDGAQPDPNAVGAQVLNLATGLFDPSQAPQGLTAYLGCTELAHEIGFGAPRPASAAKITDFSAPFSFEAHIAQGLVRSNPIPLAALQATLPGGFHIGANYTFIVMGDPAAPPSTDAKGAPNGAFDGRGLHTIAVANEPVPPRL